MSESTIIRDIQVKVSALGHRLFRNNVAMAWVGKVNRHNDGNITIQNPRPLHAGLCVGSGDLIGWKSVEVTPDMVGKKLAVFMSVEVKTKKVRVTKEQVNFQDTVVAAGGIAVVAYSVDEALRGISG